MDLAQRFIESKGGPIEVDGRLVHSIFRRKVERSTAVRLTRQASSASGPVTGLRLKVQRGSLRVNEASFADVVLWSDTSPYEVVVRCEVPKGGTELRVWNCWRDEQGVMQAWLANAGMLVAEDGGRVTLRCSSGPGGVSFDDLVVQLDFEDEG